MVNRIKPNYINPLTMMKREKKVNCLSADTLKAGEKKRKDLEAEKQLIQNSLLLMKGSSGNGETSEENIKLLEKKLDEIVTEIKTNNQEAIKNIPIDKKQTETNSVMHSVFDTYRQKDLDEATGCYRVVKDENKEYRVEYDKVN